jgi:hypothetical protein
MACLDPVGFYLDGNDALDLLERFADFPSQPVHFLANSIVGPSFYIHMPTNITYKHMDSPVSTMAAYEYSDDSLYVSPDDVACWTALRANIYRLPGSFEELSNQYNFAVLGNSTTYESVLVQYTSNCTEYVNNTDYAGAMENVHSRTGGGVTVGVGNCTLGSSVICILSNPQPKQCRMVSCYLLENWCNC